MLIRVDADALAGHLDGTAPGHGKNNYPDYLLPPRSSSCTVGGGSGE